MALNKFSIRNPRFRIPRFQKGKTWRWIVWEGSILAVILMIWALWNPSRARPGTGAAGHLAVVVDISDSVSRDPERRGEQLERIRKILAASVATLGPTQARLYRGSVISFGTEAVLHKECPLPELADALNQIPPPGSRGGGTDVESALGEAARVIRKSGLAGSVLLASDGNETKGDALRAAAELAALGTPIIVVPIEGAGPALWITDAFLPRRVKAGESATARFLIQNDSGRLLSTQIRVARNPGEDGLIDTNRIEQKAYPSQPGSTFSGRSMVKFEGRGLQFVDVAAGANAHPHRRRLYTYVESPARLLSIGGDRRWEAALDPVAWQVDATTPDGVASRIAKLEAGDYDAVSIGALHSRQLSGPFLETLTRAVRDRGVGLFLWNGDHSGQSELTETVLTTYGNTALDAILPVHVDPRKIKPEPPPRQVVILIDTSGSMAGSPLQRAQSVCHGIIDQLRPVDKLDLVAFTDSKSHVVINSNMTPEGRLVAHQQVDAMQAKGGTAPGMGLAFLAQRKLTRAALIFISDGGFDSRELSAMSVFASTNAFAIVDNTSQAAGGTFSAFPTVVPVTSVLAPNQVRLKFFEPEERKKFFERGLFTAVSERDPSMVFRGPHTALIPLNGSVICYPKPNAIVAARRPKLGDPVLIFGEAGQGRVGVFGAGLTPAWLVEPDARMAIDSWLRETLAYSDPDRYYFVVRDSGDVLDLEVTIMAKGGVVPRVDRLSVGISVVGEDAEPVSLASVPDSPGTFRGRVALSRGEKSQLTILTLTESGPDALQRSQRIPFRIAAAGEVVPPSGDEAWTQGINLPLLEGLASVSGGRILYEIESPVTSSEQRTRRFYWQELATGVALIYLAVIFIRRWNA